MPMTVSARFRWIMCMAEPANSLCVAATGNYCSTPIGLTTVKRKWQSCASVSVSSVGNGSMLKRTEDQIFGLVYLTHPSAPKGAGCGGYTWTGNYLRGCGYALTRLAFFLGWTCR